jgi:hypothetical protein
MADQNDREFTETNENDDHIDKSREATSERDDLRMRDRFHRGGYYSADYDRDSALKRGYGYDYGSRETGRGYEYGLFGSRSGYGGLYGRGYDYDIDFPEPISPEVDEEWNILGPYTGKGPRGYQRSTEQIFADVNERLIRHGYLDARDIQVEVNNAEVTLRGSVTSLYAKRLAGIIAESVKVSDA